MPETAGCGNPIVFASRAARHCANSCPVVMPGAKSTSAGGWPSAPLSLASCALVTNPRVLGSITAISTTIATTSCMPCGERWQHTAGGSGVGVAVGVGVAIGVGVAVGATVGVALGHAQVVSQGMLLGDGGGARGVRGGGGIIPRSKIPATTNEETETQ